MSQDIIHIVDDNEAEREAIVWHLKSLEFNVCAYDDARHFLRRFKDLEPAVLLFDIKMPDIDGMELLEIMREEKV